MRFRALTFVIALLITASIALCDTVVLKNGTRIVGDVKKIEGGWRVTTADGKTTDVRTDQVKAIEVGGAAEKGSPDAAMANLQSLRRSSENVPDLKQIIDRFTRFVEQNKGTPAGEEAKKDLAIWQDRFDRGLVRLGTKWVTAAERTTAANQAQTVAERAAPMVQAGRYHDAEPIIAQALETDPQCVPALYLRGVILYQQSQLPPSRKAFEAVNALISDHAPTHNNLGVILWRQNALMAALAQFDQAISAAPMNKTLLDNVAEALNAVPDDGRKNPVAQRLFRRFAEQDKQLQELMASQQGLYRWGSAWVDKNEMERYRAQELEVNTKLATAKGEMESSQKRVQTIEQEITQLDQSMRQMESNTYYRDGDGKLVRMPLPAAYYTMQSDITRLRSERTTEIAKYNTAKALTKTLQSSLPKPKFTGVAKLVGAEGMPQMMPPQPPPPAQEEQAPPTPTDPTPMPSAPPATTAPSTTAPSTNPS